MIVVDVYLFMLIGSFMGEPLVSFPINFCENIETRSLQHTLNDRFGLIKMITLPTEKAASC